MSGKQEIPPVQALPDDDEYGIPFTRQRCTVLGAQIETAAAFGRLPDMSTWLPGDLYAAAYGTATHVAADPREPRFVTPAGLSSSRRFEDVPIVWCSLDGVAIAGPAPVVQEGGLLPRPADVLRSGTPTLPPPRGS